MEKTDEVDFDSLNMIKKLQQLLFQDGFIIYGHQVRTFLTKNDLHLYLSGTNEISWKCGGIPKSDIY